MLDILKHKTYRVLFLSQLLGLLGTGLTTVALGLLAFDMAGEKAGQVLGTALAIKMCAYVFISPVIGALTTKTRRKFLLFSLNLLRAGLVLCLPFIWEIWHIYLVIFLLQAASAGYTPAYQAVIPTVLKNEEDYTKALSFSRLSYDLENLISPLMAAALLGVLTYHALFVATALSFAVATIMVLSITLPETEKPGKDDSFIKRLTRGIRRYFATPDLRATLALYLCVSSAGAMVIVNTVVYVQHHFNLTEQNTALALASFGSGSIIAAILTPALLKLTNEKVMMQISAGGLVAALFLLPQMGTYTSLLIFWFLMGLCYACVELPTGRLINRAADDQHRTSLFTAHFALSHFCWLVAYPLAGWVGVTYGLPQTANILFVMAASGLILSLVLWRKRG